MDSEHQKPGPSTRGPELALAGFLMVLAGFVIVDSVRTGIGWGDDGPKSGYFPFRIGLLLLGASGWVFVTTLLKWRETHPLFAERSQLATVMAMLIPMVVYVGGIAFLGLYVSSLVLIGYFMRRYGRFGWPLTAAVSVGVPLVFFLVFERWFLVPLPKGPIERLLGF
ncbi:tripartite tricarboxylate transporter TctB family protein [Piscinibacter gummiphilus]|uniref:Tripartite tricarboxylate transporter TctB family protein n=1 Tax=Piscinibacter gummiphilus TaxID=946333 RepID=A0ABZ0CRH2_9BURK|nr:tripartite tricarboxylate transporter TctB family protein [Piscinibacter gummiphilus]WOB07585.1 tripartite tricarboxylate transporter TctB family protein [Piscinibacter gummiphilus]